MRCWSCQHENPAAGRFCAACGAGLACPDCGAPMGPKQRFCTNCGRRIPVRGAQTVFQQVERRVQETPHFRIHYIAGSFAEQNLGMIGGRLENANALIVSLLGLDQRGDSRIDVHLSDLLDNPGQPGAPLTTGGFPVLNRRQIHEVYRSDAPGEGLEKSLALVLLTQAIGDERPRPPLLVDGFVLTVLQRLGSFPPPDQIEPMLAAAKGRRELPPVSSLVGGMTPPTQALYFQAVAGFVGFLIKAYGVDRFKQFLREAKPDTMDAAARAAYRVTLLQLDKAWQKSLKVAKPSGILRFIRLSGHYLKPHSLKVAEVLLYLGLSVGFTVAMPHFQGQLFDRALPGANPDGSPRAGDLQALLVIMGILVAAFALVSVTSLREAYQMAWVSERVMRTLRLRIFTLVQHMHPGFFQRIQTGDIMSRMTSDLAAIEFAITGALAQGLRIVLTGVAAIISIFWLDWKLASLALIGTPLFFVASKWLGPAAARASYESQQRLAVATQTLQENLGAQPIVKAFSLQNRMIDNYQNNLAELFRASIRLTFLASIFGLTANTIATVIQLGVMGVGAYLVIEGNLSLGTLLIFLGLLGQIIAPIQGISGILQALQQASGAMDRVEELMHSEILIKDAPGARPLPPPRRGIQVEHVTFSYIENQPTLRDMSLFIPAGSSVALVGPSGCGKSTLLALLMRFYEPDRGRVLFDNVEMRDGTLESLRGQMGVVFQDNILFNTSVRENIRMGKLDATDAEVEAAAKAAEIHELVMSMPEGYDTVVGERGSRLSGGQRQRVAIARAIVRNPSILLLDEATSALDPRTEAAINETLDQLSRGRTTISVTHRLSSVVNMDRIFVLDRGQLVEEGTHDDLVRKNGLYAKLWQEQGGFMIGAGVQYIGVEASRLQGVPLFARFDGDLLAALAQRLAVERFPAGDIIFNEGDAGDKLYIVHKGQAEVLAYDPVGNQRPVATLREGDYFGEMALLYDVPRTATIRARTSVQLYSLSKDDVNELFMSVPGLRREIEQVVAGRLQTNMARQA